LTSQGGDAGVLKHDGFRALAYVERGRCRFVSRKNYHFPHWPKPCQWIADDLKVKNAVLDGELACLDEQGRSKSTTFYSARTAHLLAFDLIWWDGADLRDVPLLKWKEYLKTRLPTEPAQILYADHVEDRCIELFRRVCEMNLEGIVAKRKNSLYREGTRGSRSEIRTTGACQRR
jgi:bifunctional non-homologous end joining protein LigD